MAIDYTNPAIVADAKAKLNEMYAKADYRGRVAIGRGMGYDAARTKPDSARRSAGRLASYRLGRGSKLDVTSYFRSIVEGNEIDGMREAPWTGGLPSFVLEPGETFFISAQVMYEQEDKYSGDLLGYQGNISPSMETTGTPFHSRDIRELFAGINVATDLIFLGEYKPKEGRQDEYVGIIKIGFDEAGARLIEREVGQVVPRDVDPEDGATQFGVSLNSSGVNFTKTRLKKDRKAIPRSKAAARDFPKSPARRKEIIQYIRRAYPQRVKG